MLRNANKIHFKLSHFSRVRHSTNIVITFLLVLIFLLNRWNFFLTVSNFALFFSSSKLVVWHVQRCVHEKEGVFKILPPRPGIFVAILSHQKLFEFAMDWLQSPPCLLIRKYRPLNIVGMHSTPPITFLTFFMTCLKYCIMMINIHTLEHVRHLHIGLCIELRSSFDINAVSHSNCALIQNNKPFRMIWLLWCYRFQFVNMEKQQLYFCQFIWPILVIKFGSIGHFFSFF